MAKTEEVTVSKDAWTLVAEGLATVAVQLQNNGSVRIHVADAADAPEDDNDAGLLISRGYEDVPSAWSAGGLQATGAVNVWVRSGRQEDVTILVLAY